MKSHNFPLLMKNKYFIHKDFEKVGYCPGFYISLNNKKNRKLKDYFQDCISGYAFAQYINYIENVFYFTSNIPISLIFIIQRSIKAWITEKLLEIYLHTVFFLHSKIQILEL